MNILLYNPDNGVTRNFMPHLWMFLLKALTPPEHTVFLIDGNARPMTELDLANFVRKNNVELVGIGAMTRMAARAYRAADAMRGAGAKVVFGGPHVTEVPDEPLGRTDEPRHADAVALGEADATWPRIVADAARGQLQEKYAPTDASGQEVKPDLAEYPIIPWDEIDLEQFNLISHIPGPVRYALNQLGMTWKSLHVVPIESGRGCPYGCDFCTVTGFFGDSIRFRTDESVVDELLRLKARARRDGGRIAAFFIDDNFAINVKRTKSLLRKIISEDAVIPWVAQISANLLKDEELLDLIQASGGKWIFIGMESIDSNNLAGVNKSFNKPAEYKVVLDRLASRGIYAITSFIFGMDGDSEGVSDRTVEQIESWAPGLPVYGLLTPYPATPLYDRLAKEGRLTRPRHWLEFRPFRMAFTPQGISIRQAEREVRRAWNRSYSSRAITASLQKIQDRPFHERAIMFSAKLAFRGIYFPQMKAYQWLALVIRNSPAICSLIREGVLLQLRSSNSVRIGETTRVQSGDRS
jgi:radical SAM superfamily enzyme YgiQ (UPF0313 family)